MKKNIFKLIISAIYIVLFIFQNYTPTNAESPESMHYTLQNNGDHWDGTHYYLSNGTMVKNAFFCDGTFTYYLQYDGTPMTDRLTYHPDGTHIIYFDKYGHEAFNDFKHIYTSISGNPVDDICFFDVNGYMYVDTLTYDKTGSKLYYINQYGIVENSGWFTFPGHEFEAGIGFFGKSGGYGYANADCSLMADTYTYDFNNNYVYIEADGHVAGSQLYESGKLIDATFTQNTITTSQFSDWGYWLYTPVNPTDNMPLIVYLHGGSGKGNDLDKLINNDGFPKYLYDGKLGNIPAYVLIPQLPSNMRGWIDANASLMELINTIAVSYNIDQSNISLTGHSMGGTGTWDIALLNPSKFSKIAPLSGSIKNTEENINALSSLPIRAFVGDSDTIVSPESSIAFINSLSQINQLASVTKLQNAGHFDIPALVYLNSQDNIINWLISQ